MTQPIFSALSIFSSHQEENYLTESFVYLLNFILEYSPKSAHDIINKLCGRDGWFTSKENILISTQADTEEGRPDIEIKVESRKLAYVEVKHDAPLGHKQLERYLANLKRSEMPETQLILLSRSKYAMHQTSLTPDKFHHVSWFLVAEWLKQHNDPDPVITFLVEDFIMFLKEKNMSLEKVSKALPEGMLALDSMTKMLRMAIAEVLPDYKSVNNAGHWWVGSNVHIGDENVWIGMRFPEPNLLVIENNGGNSPISFKRDLGLKEVEFYGKNEGEQFETLVKFISETIDELLNV